ncbi:MULTISPECIES: hypothetical protein [Pseudomonas syringae group]|uniref:hypothetical protein n=1 Tax=Pseudomonas syringae group TaxID=136849 RepID=UPI0004670C49|nr:MULTISPECIES: hypothetical protein [Pseudomonas syringae group]
MTQQEQLDQLLKIARHEAAHFVVAEAMGFTGKRVSIHYQAPDRYHGKADHDLTGRCDTLIAVEQYAWRRSITLMAGAIGEALNAYGEIDRKAADRIFESPDSGAGSDRSTCHEFINLIHSIIGPGTSSPAEIKNLLWKLSILLVIMHAPVVEKIARALLATIEVRSDGVRLDLTSQQIEVLLGGRVPRIDSQLDEMRIQIENL